MDIAYVVRRAFPGPGGIATHMRVVATELAGRHRVRVWAARVDDEPFSRLNTNLGAQRFAPFSRDGVEVRPLPMGARATLGAAPLALLKAPAFRGKWYAATRRATAPGYVRATGAALARDWARDGAPPEVVHCWGGEHVNWAAGRAARAGGLPLVVTPFAHPGAWGDDAMNAAFYRDARIVMALVPSEAVVYTRLGVDESRIRVVGVPSTPLPEHGPDVRARHGLGDDPIVLFLGVKEPYKGYRTMLEALGGIRARARFAFVGPRTAASEADFARVDDDRVVEVGAVPDGEVGSWLRAATVFCLPSTSEILPGVILEAWQAGKPVVAAEWWCARDLVTHERDGLVVSADAGGVARAIDALLSDPEGARAMGEAGRAKVLASYTPAAVAARHEAALREALTT